MAESMPPEDLQDHLLEDDYYAFLNLSKDASSDEITKAYRNLSKLYHPDKHMDPLQKKNAEIMFNKAKVAYEALSDSHMRAIYDTVGVKGLETQGWEIVERRKTPQEIREEYEELVRVKNERMLQQQTNARGTIKVGVNATDLFESYDLRAGLPNIEISNMSISQSVEAPLHMSEWLHLDGNVTVQNGTGGGHVNCSWKKYFSTKTWLQTGIGAGNGFALHFKWYRTLSAYSSATLHTNFHFVGDRMAPGVELMLARQFTKGTAGYLTLKAGTPSLVNTYVAHDSEKGRFIAGIQCGIQQSFLTLNYTWKLKDSGKLKTILKLGTFGIIFEYGCETKISTNSIVGATMSLGVPTGVTLKIKISRANQTFIFPIMLSDEVLPSAILYGSTVPVLGYCIFKTLYLEPYKKMQKLRETEKTKEANAQRIAEKKKEASIAVSLMQEAFRRITSEEERKSGLIISLALYGNAETITNVDLSQVDSQLDVLNATVQLQCLVTNSRLVLPDRPKSNLPGFYDPCVGEDKLLRVDYVYRNKNHSITVADNEMLRIPRISDI